MAQVTKTFTVNRVDASKANVVASDAVPAVPLPDTCVISLQNVDSYRQVEINSCITQLRDFMMENDFTEAITVASLSLAIDGGKGSITPGVSGDDNQVILSYSNETGKDLGTEIFTAMVEYCRMAMRDNYLKLL